MPEQALLKVFQDLIREKKIPVLVSFHHAKPDSSSALFTEILQSDYRGRLRIFEFNLDLSGEIIRHYRLPQRETAVIFQNGKTHPYLQGYRNVRNYLRVLMHYA